MGSNFNPYEAPQSMQAARPAQEDPSEFERIRKQHLNHEASLQGIGSLYCLGAGLLIAGAALGLIGSAVEEHYDQAGIMALFVALGVLQGWIGLGLRRLRPNVKVAAGIVSAIGLLAFPMGTLINGYILYLLFSQKGTYILSPGYQEIIAATPHIRYRTSIIVWIFLGLLVFVIGLGILGAILNSR
jgi:hypothetical protein